MDNLSEYQKMRGSNLGRNWQILAELGVKLPNPSSRVVLQKTKPKPLLKKPVKRVPRSRSPNVSRFTLRVRLKADDEDYDPDDEKYGQSSDTDSDDDTKQPPREPRFRIPRPNTHGKVEGVKVGDWWRTRLDCSADGIHRPTVAGIHGGPDGAYSVAISGGYEDDVDLGESFTYTGEGGRDLKGTVNKPKNLRTAPQSKDQTLTRGNLALARNVETGNPVRVIRGYKLNNEFAPEEGYRYDGLYQVKKYWEATGKAGFKVFKFAFVRCDSEPAPWTMVELKPKTDERVMEDCDNSSDKDNKNCGEALPVSENPEVSPNRKTVVFNLTPGVKSPIKVPDDLEDIKPCVVNLMNLEKTSHNEEDPIDSEFHGWEEFDEMKGHCLVVEFDSVQVKVYLENGEWKELQSNSSKSPQLSVM